jgi:CDP-diacylglycerol---glycerol-3-phosphate 3-phosphatidyltransferase
MLSEAIGSWVRSKMLVVGRAFASIGITPNMATIIGLVLNVIVAVILGFGHPIIAGVLLLLASAFDMVDGSIARATNTISKFGGFFDSTIDRYSEIVVYIGLLVWLNSEGANNLGSVLILVACTGALMVSYARARAEALGYKASVGILARPERVILLALCLIIKQPMWALWVLAVLTHVTAVWRIWHVHGEAAAEGEIHSQKQQS